MSEWEEPGFLAAATHWVVARLADLGSSGGAVEQPHVHPWSTVLRVPTPGGPVWFKANAAPLRPRGGAGRGAGGHPRPPRPPLLARDPARGWMLLADAGPTLRTVTEEAAWLAGWREVLPAYAALQVAWADRATGLLALGLPDRRLGTLVEGYHALLDAVGAERRFHEAVPYVARLVERVAAGGVPETVQHDDLHDGQIFGGPGSYRLLDWGDACLSHPFFTLSVSLEGVVAWGLADQPDSVGLDDYVAAYLAPFRAAYGDQVAALVPDALRLGWVCRAVNGYQPGEEERTLTRLRMFLDGRPD
ncbi:MAG: phosphotransferase [Nocardioides sp.]